MFGYDCLGRLQLTLGTAGPHVMAELAQSFAPAPMGLFAAFCPPVQGVPALQRAVPKHGSWRVGHFDFRALCETGFAMVDTLRRGDKIDARAEAKQELGFDLIDDLFAHTTDELLVVGAALQEIERPEDFTWAAAVRLRDEKKFAQGLATLLEKARPAVQRGEPQTIEGLVCQRYGTAINYRLWVATGHDTLFVAAGRDGAERLAEVIAAAKRPADAVPAADVVARTFADLGKYMPPGLNTQARVDLDGVFALPSKLWDLVLYGALRMSGPPSPEPDADQREQMHALLREHNLGTLRTATGYADATWRWRVFW